MDEQDRIKRPPAERTEPRRQWSSGVGAEQPDASRQTKQPQDAAYQTINDAYRLIDDYMRQGQQMAENFWVPLGDAAAPFREAPERFLRALGDMTMAWVEVMQQWTATAPSAGSQTATGRAGPFAGVTPSATGTGDTRVTPSTNTPAAGAAGSASLRVAVTAANPIELVVDLSERVEAAELILTELRDPVGGNAPLTDVSIRPGVDGAPYVKVVVPAEHGLGTYNGLFLDRTTRRPRGTLSLTLLAPE
jgi:hypothetical protein